MGKIVFDPQQKIIVDGVKNDDFLSTHFYFTGGTALSVFHLGHRLSEDLDFFSEKPAPFDRVNTLIKSLSEKHHFSYELRRPEVEGLDIMVFYLDFGKGRKLKIDFNNYPYKSIEPRLHIDGLWVDTKRDIGTNKLLTIDQRTDVKDFVDLYFLLQEYTVWDLLYGVEIKFGMEMEPLTVASNFMKVEEFKSLPKMLVALKISQLQDFFRSGAKELAKKAVK